MSDSDLEPTINTLIKWKILPPREDSWHYLTLYKKNKEQFHHSRAQDGRTCEKIRLCRCEVVSYFFLTPLQQNGF
jgi:hypothetical protein